MARASTARSTQEATGRARAADDQRGAFTLKTPKRIAARLKDPAEDTDRSHDPYRSAMAALTGRISRGAAQLPTKEKKRLEKAKEELRQLFQRPSTGRTTALGRRVEKPGTGRQSGPSGQTDSTTHDRKHTNK